MPSGEVPARSESALGLALIMEGVLSGCYHICPTKVHFQFDTTFMYAMAVLVFLKVYQFRHPDITSNAYTVFSFISVALFLEVIGYYFNNVVFWAVFLFAYLFIILSFIVHTYYYGRFSLFKDAWTNIFEVRTRAQLRPARTSKFCLCLLVFAANLLLAGFFGAMRKPGISKYLLVILIGNMAIYVGYYCSMKVHYWLRRKEANERINVVSVTYGLVSLVSTILGVYLFTKELKNSGMTPSESRDINGPCAVSIFDNHDLWHLFSGLGLYSIFMLILTLEDGNLDTRWDQIHVF